MRDRKRHRAALTHEVEAALASKPAAEWETILIGVGIPAGRVVTVPEALENPQVKHRDLLQAFDDVPGVDRSISVTRAGFKLSGARPSAHSPPPCLGEHTDEVLLSLGYTSDEIASLRNARAI